MKHTRKILSFLLALTVMFSMTITVFAQEQVTNTTNHTYKAYQIFSGTQDGQSHALGDIDWGNGIQAAEFLSALKTRTEFVKNEANIFANASTAAQVAEILAQNNDIAAKFAHVAAQNTKGDGTEIGSAQTAQLPAGYYLIVDTSVPGQDDAKNSALLQVTGKGNIEITAKYSVPTIDKSVKESTDDTYGESADWEIGSDVVFRLDGTLPDNFNDYEAYKYVFHDTLCGTLQYNEDQPGAAVKKGVRVYKVVSGGSTEEITSGYTVTTSGNKLTVEFKDLKAALKNVTDPKTITIRVEYTAKLLETAVIGQTDDVTKNGNDNTVYLEYSNNPDADKDTITGDSSPTGNTKTDRVIVYTYKLALDKHDAQDEQKKLDASFVLLNNDSSKVALFNGEKITGWEAVPANGADGKPAWKDASLIKTGSTGLANIIGLDATTYHLREVKAPAGYNLLTKDIEIVIQSTLDKSEDSPELEGLRIQADGTGTEGTIATGSVSLKVANNQGSLLPETGGIGTTIFYVGGTALILLFIVLVVMRRRRSHNG